MKHIELLKAWVDGETIQYKDKLVAGGWIDVKAITSCTSCPAFFDGYEYRKKPQIVKYRRWIVKGPHAPHGAIGLVYSDELAREIQHSPHFVRWIDTEWQEEEV